MGDTGGACGVASAPDGPAGPAAAVCRHRHRDRAPATPGLWPALAANRRAAALVVYPARSGHWHSRPHDLLPAQPRPDAGLLVGTGPEDWACSRRDRRNRAESVRRWRMAGRKAWRAWPTDLAQAPPGGGPEQR